MALLVFGGGHGAREREGRGRDRGGGGGRDGESTIAADSERAEGRETEREREGATTMASPKTERGTGSWARKPTLCTHPLRPHVHPVACARPTPFNRRVLGRKRCCSRWAPRGTISRSWTALTSSSTQNRIEPSSRDHGEKPHAVPLGTARPGHGPAASRDWLRGRAAPTSGG